MAAPADPASRPRSLGWTPLPAALGRTIRPLGRALRRLRLLVARPECLLVFHPRYARETPGVPMDPLRGEKVLAFLEAEGMLRRGFLLEARPANFQRLLRVHTPEYLFALPEPETLTRILGFAVSARDAEHVLDHQRLMTGGTLAAARWALRTGGIGVNLGGGFHHAKAGEGMGFCALNDVAVAIAALRDWGNTDPVLVVDLDMHDGNGTRAIFAADPTVHTFSVHREAWSDESAVQDTQIALGPGVDDRRYLGAIADALPKVAEAVKPGVVFYLAGVDAAADDRLGDWRISAAALLERDRFVTRLVRDRKDKVPMVVTLAGGYGESAWRYSARYLAWLLSGDSLEPPPDEEMLLARYRRLAGASLPPDGAPRGWDALTFQLDENDLFAIGTRMSGEQRFLGYFSRNGVELALERLGLLQRLRDKGFGVLRLDLDLSGPTGQTLRIGIEGTKQILVELRVARSRRPLPGFEVVVIEWLLLQNPRAAFPAGRPPLPGQQHPGLGMLKDFLGWLVVLCERLRLDGIYFAPSQYHIAVQSRRLVRFVEPAHEARMRAYLEALADLPLHEASRLAAEGRILDATSGQPARWEAVPMVLPVSEALKERVFGPEYEARVAEAGASLRFTVSGATPAT